MRQRGVAHVDVLLLGLQLVVENVGRHVDQLQSHTTDSIDDFGADFELEKVEGRDHIEIVVVELIAVLEFVLDLGDAFISLEKACLVAFELEHHLAQVIWREFKNFLEGVLFLGLLLLVLALVDNKGLFLANQSLVDFVLEKGLESVRGQVNNNDGLLQFVEDLRILLNSKKDFLILNEDFDDKGKEHNGRQDVKIMENDSYNDPRVEFLHGGHHCDSERVDIQSQKNNLDHQVGVQQNHQNPISDQH